MFGSDEERNLSAEERAKAQAEAEAKAKEDEEKAAKFARGSSALARAFGIKGDKVDTERKLVLQKHRNNIRAAIIGLPNTGKSQLFNVLTDSTVPVDEAVFTTCRPNFGQCLFPDSRFDWLKDYFKPTSTFRTYLRVTDCPGIIRNSWRNAGIGGDFMVHAGKCDMLYVMIRAFGGQKTTHVLNTINPLRDIDLMIGEMIKFDQQTVRLEFNSMSKLVEARAGGSQLRGEYNAIQRIQKYLLEEGKPLRFGSWEDQDVVLIRRLNLLTAKEPVYVINMDTRDYLRFEFHGLPTSLMGRVREHIDTKHGGGLVIPYSGDFEQRLMNLRRNATGPPESHYTLENEVPPAHIPGGLQMPTSPTNGSMTSSRSSNLLESERYGELESDDDEDKDDGSGDGDESKGQTNLEAPPVPPSPVEQKETYAGLSLGDAVVAAYLRDNPTHKSSREILITSAFKVLRLGQFFTAGPDELRSWTVPRDTKAPIAGGFIHHDIETSFMSVEVESFLDLRDLGSEVEVASHGKLTQQGKAYAIQDGDICFFKLRLPNYRPGGGV